MRKQILLSASNFLGKVAITTVFFFLESTNNYTENQNCHKILEIRQKVSSDLAAYMRNTFHGGTGVIV